MIVGEKFVMENKKMENRYCKTCKFYNVGCHPITKNKYIYHININDKPDCWKEGKTKKTKAMSYRNFDNFFKRIEKKNLQEKGESLTWVSMLNRSGKAIIETHEDTKIVMVDMDKMNELKEEFIEG